MVSRVHTALKSSPGADYAWPGNVRELEQAVRRIFLTHQYQGGHKTVPPDLCGRLQVGIGNGALDADTLLAGYCQFLYLRLGSYEAVAQRTKLDRRTVKAYIQRNSLR
jgi:DNA-binding NtrC family response regulator